MTTDSSNKAHKAHKPDSKPRKQKQSHPSKNHGAVSRAASKAMDTMVPASEEAYTILFHGNCIDGWFSCYIAYTVLRKKGTLQMFPIATGQPNTWPSAAVLNGTHILMVDVSVPEETRKHWIAKGARSILCIDHHATAIEQWPAEHCPIHLESCAAIQTWMHFYPSLEIPFWLYQIDRIDRWDQPTEDDRCIREILIKIAHKPVMKRLDQAIEMTETFIREASVHTGWLENVEKGRLILEKKDEELRKILAAGYTVCLSETECMAWQLPETWLGKIVYIIDNTDQVFDSTEASHLVFTHYPETDIFVNYRKKSFYVGGKQNAMSENQKMIVYSVRSHGFPLTERTVFRGHSTSAGASLLVGKASCFPFLPIGSLFE